MIMRVFGKCSFEIKEGSSKGVPPIFPVPSIEEHDKKEHDYELGMTSPSESLLPLLRVHTPSV